MPRLNPDDPRLAAPDFPHGEQRGYDSGCSCRECRAANAARSGLRRQAQTGSPQRCVYGSRVTAARAKAHVLGLIEADPRLNVATVASAAGVPQSIVHDFVSGSREHISETTEEYVLGVTLQAAAARIIRRYADIVPTIDHLMELLDAECGTVPNIAAATGINISNITAILAGKRDKVFVKTAEVIAATTPAHLRAVAAFVPGRMARQRIRSLQANGWPLPYLAERLGYLSRAGIRWLTATDSPINADTDRRVTALYAEIGDRRGPNERTARYARKLGNWPPIHYDEDMRLLKDSIPRAGAYVPLVTAQERARLRLRIMGLTIRSYTAAEIVKVIGGGCDKTIERARREVGLRLENNQNILADLPYIKPGQGEMVALIAEHTAPLALLEAVDSVDEPGTDHVALWESLLAGARRVRAAAAYVALWESLLTEAEQSDQAAA